MNIDALQKFASENNFDLTAPLSNDQVTLLAKHWLPQIRFYEDERFHPIGLNEALSMVDAQFKEMSPLTQESFKVTKFVRDGSVAKSQAFDPPLVTIPNGSAPLEGAVNNQRKKTVRVLTESEVPLSALTNDKIGKDARVTHGGSETRSRRFFGATQTVLGGDISSPGDPLVPRAGTINRNGEIVPHIVIMASYKNLLETLEYNLLTSKEDSYPLDALRMGFDIISDLFIIQTTESVPTVTQEQQRAVMLELITAHKNGDSLPSLPSSIRLNWKVWDKLTRYAFLEYSLYYAYNDFERYQTAIWDNEHEGDDEGFCLVFDRNLINLALSSNNNDALFMVQPHSIITSVHEEYQGADESKIFSTPSSLATNKEALRDAINPIVWVAGGSHATYLTSGTHDLVDFGDYLGWVNEKASWLWLVGPAVLAVAIILHILEHFIDTEDFTSDDGIQTGYNTDPENDKLSIAHEVKIFPMSGDRHIYQAEENDLLTLIAYPGYWGDHDEIIDKSPPFIPKTGRFFRKLIDIA